MKSKIVIVNSLLIVLIGSLVTLKASSSTEKSESINYYCSCPTDALENYLNDLEGNREAIAYAIPEPEGKKCPRKSISCFRRKCEVHIYAIFPNSHYTGYTLPVVVDAGKTLIRCTALIPAYQKFTLNRDVVRQYLNAVKKARSAQN